MQRDAAAIQKQPKKTRPPRGEPAGQTRAGSRRCPRKEREPKEIPRPRVPRPPHRGRGGPPASQPHAHAHHTRSPKPRERPPGHELPKEKTREAQFQRATKAAEGRRKKAAPRHQVPKKQRSSHVGEVRTGKTKPKGEMPLSHSGVTRRRGRREDARKMGGNQLQSPKHPRHSDMMTKETTKPRKTSASSQIRQRIRKTVAASIQRLRLSKRGSAAVFRDETAPQAAS